MAVTVIENAKKEIKLLCEKYYVYQSEYESDDYLERQLQTDFLDDFFKIMGWDVTNSKKLPLHLRDVLVEKGDTQGRPDYTFRLNGDDVFFVEAKSPYRGTSKHGDIFQAKRYGWSTRRVTISILTDFKTFRVYDTTIKPNINQPNLGLLFESNIDNYIEEFEKIWMFSFDRVRNGSIDELIRQSPVSKRMRIPMDVDFLEQLTKWREDLAKNYFKNNDDLDVRLLNDIVQKLLDRLIFIRLLEDRDIVRNRSLYIIAENWTISKHRDIQFELNMLFNQFNKDFNGDIFKYHPCETFFYDSDLVAEIIFDLYPPNSPYDFSVIGVELLGQIYEKYLGKTIRLTPKRVKVEEKPEVRKAGGVYYTPKWIVDYIVDNTVGKLISKQTPENISKIKILDPACGSGSFLIEALNELYIYHLDYYLANPKESKEGTLFPNIVWINEIPQLSIYAKSRILENNIFGVDLDPQAVEITMMSLYIKVLEGERTLPRNKELLPSLGNNIRCGNSLIGFDYFNQTKLDSTITKNEINPFEWESESEGFGSILNDGGFDAIIGNPPYIRIQILIETNPNISKYYSKKYIAGKRGNYDIYVLFVEKSIQLMKKNGLLGYILPNKFMLANYGKNLRRILADKKLLEKIISFSDQQVFDGATTYTCLLFLSKKKKDIVKYYELSNSDIKRELLTLSKDNFITVKYSNITEENWIFRDKKILDLMDKLDEKSQPLESLCERIFQGIRTSANNIYLLEKVDTNTYYSKYLDENRFIEKDLLKPFLKGNEMRKWYVKYNDLYVLNPYRNENGKIKLISEKELVSNYPKTWDYLVECKKYLENRERGKMKHRDWYGYVYPKNLDVIQDKKIITRDIVADLSFSLDKQGFYSFVTGYGLIPKDDVNYLFLLSLLNSNILNFYFKQISSRLKGGFYRPFPIYIDKLPIIKTEKKVEDELSILSDRIIKINANRNNKSELTAISKREFNILTEKMNKIIYELYELTKEEIEIVEKNI